MKFNRIGRRLGKGLAFFSLLVLSHGGCQVAA